MLKFLLLLLFSSILFSQNSESSLNKTQQANIKNSNIVLATNSSTDEPSSSGLTGTIKISGRQLLVLVDGVWHPFIMKGVCYNPVRKGDTCPKGLITLNPTEEELVRIDGDFDLMEKAGINTIRTYYPIKNAAVLDLAVKHHLKIIVPLLLNYRTQLSEVDEIIDRLQNEPSTLIWEVGNEWNNNYLYSRKPSFPDGIGFERSKKIVQKFINHIKKKDLTHPVSTCVNGIPCIDSSSQLVWNGLKLENIDIYAMNVYDGYSFGPRISQWKKFMEKKPLYIGEFGASAFNSTINQNRGGKDEVSQAKAIGDLTQEIKNNLSACSADNALLGGCIFEFCDEWWKGEFEQHPELHSTNGILDIWDYDLDGTRGGPYPDHIFHERWFGIFTIDRNPRAAYFKVKELWSNFNTP